jgi:hypothetical protein
MVFVFDVEIGKVFLIALQVFNSPLIRQGGTYRSAQIKNKSREERSILDGLVSIIESKG